LLQNIDHSNQQSVNGIYLILNSKYTTFNGLASYATPFKKEPASF